MINLKVSGMAAILMAITLIPGFIVGLILSSKPDTPNITLIASSFTALDLILSLVVFMGFLRVADLSKNKTLEMSMYLLIVLTLVLDASAIMTGYETSTSMFSVLLFVVIGITMVVAGIAMLKLKESFGGLGTALGVMYIISGVAYMTIILLLLIPVIGVVTGIIEAIFFFKASDFYAKTLNSTAQTQPKLDGS